MTVPGRDRNLGLARRGRENSEAEITSRLQETRQVSPGTSLCPRHSVSATRRVPKTSLGALSSPPMQTPDRVPFSDRLDVLERAVRRARKAPDIGAPQIGIVLGSGLGGLADSLTDVTALPFADLPGWPPASAPGHAGRLLLGRLEGVPVVCLQGRLHMYEGHSERLVVEPVLLMGRLGARQILLTNAAGGINADWPAGTLMLLTDHLNLTGRSPLMGPNDDALGQRFPDLVDAYSPRLRALMRTAAADEGIELAEGVYAGPDRTYLRDAGRGAHASRAGRRCGRHVDRARGGRRALGRARGLRRVARHQPRRRRDRSAAEPRRGARGRRARPVRGSPASSAGSSSSPRRRDRPTRYRARGADCRRDLRCSPVCAWRSYPVRSSWWRR